MTICENLGFYNYFFTRDTFNRKTPAIDLGPNPLNYDPAAPVTLLVWHASQPPRCAMQSRRSPAGMASSRVIVHNLARSVT